MLSSVREIGPAEASSETAGHCGKKFKKAPKRPRLHLNTISYKLAAKDAVQRISIADDEDLPARRRNPEVRYIWNRRVFNTAISNPL